MKGLELSRQYYITYGEPMLREGFGHLMPLVAVGLVGSGSECLGYDDEASRDHDFEPGFCIFLPDEDTVDRTTAFALERAYAKLPRTFMGYQRAPLDPVGGARHGVIRMADFFMSKTGTPDGCLPVDGWFSIPEQALLEATNGQIFYDGSGELTAIRERLSYLPEDVRLKKLAGRLFLMGQAGQYNYDRCIKRGETAAAQLAMSEFVQSSIHAIFLLNRAYLPYYKWSFRALRELPLLSDVAPTLEYLISSGNRQDDVPCKRKAMEAVCTSVMTTLRAQGLIHGAETAMEAHAYAVNDRISDGRVRNLHLLYGV